MITAIIFILTINSCKVPQAFTSAKKFRGMWKLDKFETLDAVTSKWNIDSTRIGYTGYILYDGLGHIAVQQNPPGYKDADVSRNIDSMDNRELKKIARLYRSNYVYFGGYTIENKTIVHKRLSATNPEDWNTILKRDFKFSGDTLLLTTQEKVNGSILRIRWIKF